MAAQTAISPDLTDDDKALAFQFLDTYLNCIILYSLLHGIYTGILAVTLWNTFDHKCRPMIRRSTIVVIVLLHTLTTINFAFSWSTIHLAFIKNGQNFLTIYLRLADLARAFFWGNGITAVFATILADSYTVYGVVGWFGDNAGVLFYLQYFPSFLQQVKYLISSTLFVYPTLNAVSKFIKEYYDVSFNTSPEVFQLLYASLILATTLWCTSLILYRILSVVGIGCGADGRLRVYRHFIEVLVESSALYSISLIVYLALAIHQDYGMHYLEIIAAIARGIAPTLLVGRAAAGHTHPKDNRNDSTVSTLHFWTPSELCLTSFLEESTMQSAVFRIDIEAQP
ncbi:hypothetical protein IW261DRAFT_1628492 [Armillaria novae-zelandiae]|uniref:Uncharacterized protein n=1 Tax=Armillaria novae-zelandiae TaxID=153914 RepID=A0AA39P7U6_9AGAR|nr:hypothetical protein IW261DRAFT_1628492 [Armillaria novae-zelandiae]